MSDLNDDLLNYELGEELDELVGDDDLLLSDEELEKEKAALKDEAEQWVSSKLKTTDVEETKGVSNKEPEQVSTTSSAEKNQLEQNDTPNCNPSITNKNNSNSESDVSTSGQNQIKKSTEIEQYLTEHITNENEIENNNITKIDEVTSTNKEVGIDSDISQKSNVIKDDTIISSQESSYLERSTDQDVGEDGDEQQQRGERTNIKHTTERDDNMDSSPEKYSHGGNVSGRYMHSKRGGGRGVMRGGIFPGQRTPLPVPPNQFPGPHHYHQGINNPMPPRPPQFHPQNNIINGPRLEYRPNFRHPSDFSGGGMFNLRGPRPTQAHPNGPPYNSFPHQHNNLRPMFRPDMQHIRPRIPLRPPSAGMPPINYPITASTGQGPHSIQPHAQHHVHSHANLIGNQISSGGTSGSVTTVSQSATGNSVMPRKVLINPNFKGGVEAATNQLMKDTQFMQSINSHVPHLQSDEELLRQQEEFINKNRIHIQKRYARSPDRNRERSYSPPIRKDRYLDSRDNRRGFGAGRGRGRRGGSREIDTKFAKRRRSSTPDRKRDKDQNDEPEDEETRAYRLEIEKQKAMREKILRDKEMRRRKAAEGKTQTDESSSLPEDYPPAKLKPIIVTESKIISLKKNKEIETNSKQSTIPTPAIISTNVGKTIVTETQQLQTQSKQHFALKRALPTAKILPEAKRNISEHIKKEISALGTSTTAVVRPVIKNKQTAKVQTDFNKDDILDDYEDEDELLEEERLLADTPSPPHTPNDSDNSDHNTGDDDNNEPEFKKSNKAFMSSNRKVVLKSSTTTDVKPKKTSICTKTADSKKRIFDRLEKKKIGVNENDKRRIQRIFIKNIE